MDYYAYRAQIRDAKDLPHIDKDTLTWGGSLYQQYMVDMWVKIEQERLNYIQNHQDEIKAECYAGLADAVAANATRDAGSYVVLNSSFTGSPRYMQQNYQDAMATVAKFGRPDYFITMTCNPKWPEINAHLREGEQASDRPDLTARVFNMKFKELLDDLTKRHILGHVVAYCAVIEFQKRGLPHAHILLIVRDEDKLHTCDQYDLVISAELPDPTTHPKLREMVLRHMIHGPCGNLNPTCMQCLNAQGTCSKHFPKPAQELTTDGIDAYPQYRRRNRFPARKAISNNIDIEINDQWVVPYNKWLLYKYNCHINVEVCISVSAVKYLFKYIYKGHDKATITIENEGQQNAQQAPVEVDEIKTYIDSRYIGAQEAFWRISGYELSHRHPPVQRLQIHLPHMQQVLYFPGVYVYVYVHVYVVCVCVCMCMCVCARVRAYVYAQMCLCVRARK
jgi:Helitron helicase-like domain at N-terminus